MGAKRFVLTLGLVMACGGKGEREAPRPTVALELSGAVTASLAGKGGMCEVNRAGTDHGVTIRSSELGAHPELTVYLGAVADQSGTAESGGARLSVGESLFVSEVDPGVKLSASTVYAVDTTVKEDGGSRTVRIKGEVTCPAP